MLIQKSIGIPVFSGSKLLLSAIFVRALVMTKMAAVNSGASSKRRRTFQHNGKTVLTVELSRVIVEQQTSRNSVHSGPYNGEKKMTKDGKLKL